MPRRVPVELMFGIRPTVETNDDFRQVPSSDRGNASYSDRGQLGGYAPSNEPYPAPRDVEFETGFGCSMEDARRGYVVPGLHEDPAYDFENYRDRMTVPKSPSPESDDFVDRREVNFRARGMVSRGFLTRGRGSM
jgi:hypothetical protein